MAYDPFDPAQAADPFAALAEARQDGPLAAPRAGMVMVTRHAESCVVGRDHRAFSSEGLVSAMTSRDEVPPERQLLVEMDPPRHSQLRRLLISALSPKAVDAAAPSVEKICLELVDAFADLDRVELVGALAAPLPSRVITHLIGVPEADYAMFRKWVDVMVETGSSDPATPRPTDAHDAAVAALEEYIAGQIAERRQSNAPPDDLITRLARAVDEGRTLTDIEIVTQVRLLIMAGNETTTSLIANLVHQLAVEPERYRRVRADRRLVASSIEESLRFDSPIQLLLRRATADTELSGCPVRSGQLVLVSTASANRDEAVYRDAETFDVEREAGGHLAFGIGPHLCLGAPLARLEARLAVNALMDRVAAVELAPGYVYEKVPTFMFRAPTRLDLLLGQS